jgi:coenzyme F420-0:L-glutamate ligase/coenzyme F420-1:gamma-L-glutamate ligase
MWVDFSPAKLPKSLRREKVPHTSIQLFNISGIPEIEKGMNLASVILDSLKESDLALQEGDILVLAHSVVSKAEGRVVHSATVEVSKRAYEIAESNGFDPVHVELALRESQAVIRDKGALITETSFGLICNFSGVDRSNAPPDSFVLLPQNPDESAARILRNLVEKTGLELAVIIADTQGRPWREGSVNIALGCAGINAFKYNKGKQDLYGKPLHRSTICQIDELSSAAEPLMGQADEGTPVVVIRGYEYSSGRETARDVPRSKEEDLFR